MVHIGYTTMTEQAGPHELVGHVARAEEVGFDFSVTSDHYFPWLRPRGHAPYAWRKPDELDIAQDALTESGVPGDTRWWPHPPQRAR